MGDVGVVTPKRFPRVSGADGHRRRREDSGSFPPAMALTLSSLPAGLDWLRPTYRPSTEEVTAYAEFIAVAEGHPDRATDDHLRDEAELQLWIWRAETRTRTPRSNRPRAVPKLAPPAR